MHEGHELGMLLRKAYLAFHRRANSWMLDHGVTADQFVLLTVVSREPAPCPPPKQMASRPVVRLSAGERRNARRLKDSCPRLLTPIRLPAYFARKRMT